MSNTLPDVGRIGQGNILAKMNLSDQTKAAALIVANAAEAGRTISFDDAAFHVAQLAGASARPFMDFVRSDNNEQRNFERTVTALSEGLQYGNTAFLLGAAIVASEVHNVLLFAHMAPPRLFGLPLDQQMGDRLIVLHTALGIGRPEDGSVQEQLVGRYVLPEGAPEVQQAIVQAITPLIRTAG